MSKKRDKTHSAKLSPTGYIRKRSRQLDLKECFINSDWKESGLANILIVRKHKSQNLTLSFYLVDLYCKGVKDSHFMFNISNYEYQEILSHFQSESLGINCSYVLAHNIIFEALEFAKSNGFSAYKEFLHTTIHFLEEDTEDIEMKEIEVGLNGKPCLIVNPDDQNTKNEIAILEKHVGQGNYDIIYLDEEGNEIQEGEDDISFSSEELEKKTLEALEELEEMKNWTSDDWEKFKSGEKVLSDETSLVLSDMLFYSHFSQDELLEAEEEIVTLFDLEIDFEEKENNLDINLKDNIILINDVRDKTGPKRAIKLYKNLMSDYPGVPELYLNLISLHQEAGNDKEANLLMEHACQIFPKNLLLRLAYAIQLLHEEKMEMFLKVLDNKFSLPELLPEQKSYHIKDFIIFQLMMFQYMVTTNKILMADMIFNQIVEMEILSGDDLEEMNETLLNAKMDIIDQTIEKMEKNGDYPISNTQMRVIK